MAKLEVLPQSWGTRYWFYCPGCQGGHAFHVRTDGSPHGEPSWTFNGDLERPTFAPSLLTSGVVPLSDDALDVLAAGGHVAAAPSVCHLFVAGGTIRFLDDCTHKLRGRTVALPDAE